LQAELVLTASEETITVEKSRIQQAVADILEAIGEDPNREGLEQTPARVARMYQSLFAGVGVRVEDAIDAVFESEANDPVAVSRLPFYSVCEHHLLPFFGEARMGYVPQGKIAGISKLGRALEVAAARPQVQERLTAEVADALSIVLQPRIVVVELQAEHLCMSMRGISKPGTRMLTTAIRGTSATEEDRETLLSLMRNS
jgi:GTP cyclohydrolase I